MIRILYGLVFQLFLLDLAHANSPDRVIVGAYINDIHNLNLREHTFHADVYIWFRWKDRSRDPSATLEVMNPAELWALSRVPSYDAPVDLPNAEFYQVLRLQGSFAEKFDLSNYPFDPQRIHIDFEDNRDDISTVSYAIDEVPVTLNPVTRLPGYLIGQPRLNIEEVSYPTNFGDTRPQFAGRTYSRIRLEIPIRRPILPNALKLLIPVICVIFCASLMFMFNPTYVDSRVGIGITALLTVVALQITLNEDLPEVDYVVLIDKVYLITYLYVISGLAIVVKTTWMLDSGSHQIDRAVAIDRRCLIGLTLIYFLILSSLVALAFVV